MSSIEKLTIQGIRSFGSKSEDVQAINFSSPVTLILGKNGCGKTTIIECLKYALTGEAPPGSNRGQNFIHDPKIFNFGESLGQIKLMVRNIMQERVTVCRSMKISQKRGRPCFETLEANVSTNRGDKTDSTSKRCADVDVAMCQFMGVSKAILNNVVFCHQEDSSWPLDEPKKLKEKFDAIFGIAEYNKAIERIVKFRKEYSDDLKLKESNLKFLCHLKQEMEDKELSLQKAKDNCNKVKELCTLCDAEMKPIEDRLQEIRKIEYEVGKCQAEKVELETKQQNLGDQIKSLKSKIKNQFTGSIEELKHEIEIFKQRMIDKKIELRQLQDKLTLLKDHEKHLQKILVDLDKKRASVIQQREKEQECQAELVDKIKILCEQLSIVLNKDLENNHEYIADTLQQIQNALMAEQKKISDLSLEFDRQEQQLQLDIDELRVQLTKMEEGVATLKKNKERQETQLRGVEFKINEMEVSSDNLKKIIVEIERIDKCYEQVNQKFKQDELKELIANGKTKVTNLQENFRTIDERLTFLNSITKFTSEISLKEKELEKKELEIQRLKNKHNDNFKNVFDRPIERNFRRNLQEVINDKLQRQIKENTEKINALKLKRQSLEINRKRLKEEILRAEKEMEDSKEKIYEKCQSVPYNILITKCKESVSKCQLEYGALRSSEALYKRYIQKIEDYPCCPLCHKGFSGDEATNLVTELSDEIQSLPRNIILAEKQLKLEQQKYEELLQIKPILDKVTRLEKDIPKLNNDLKEAERKLNECTNQTEELELVVGEPNAKLELANSMLGDMLLLDEAVKDVLRLKEDISNLRSKLPQGSFENISVEEVQMEKATISAELENERTFLEKMQKDYEEGVDALNKLREKRNALKDKQNKLQEGVQSLPQLQEQKKEIMKTIGSNAEEINDLQLKIPSLKQKLSSAINVKSTHKEENRKKLAGLNLKNDSLKKIHHDVQRLSKELTQYIKLNLTAECEELKRSIKDKSTEVKEKGNTILKQTESLEALKNECANQESLERDLKDNLEVLILEQRMRDEGKQLEKLLKLIGDLDFRNVSREKNDLIEKRDAGTIRKGELLGKIGEINNQISKLNQEINEPKYKESVKNYRRCLYEVSVIKAMISDLGQYRITLERSLMQFHTEKMERINRLIREYWRQIYRGNDVDFIQIETDEGKVETSADRRRNYNYRVVQSKNGSVIEMRGRCSAGQRVLASLIIRMALAETFSSNCGVLALDEPTTNLDQDNILSLCEALNAIVDTRQAQSNFMLIIITHDENFISTLGKINSYHRVFRNDEGKSVIRKVSLALN